MEQVRRKTWWKTTLISQEKPCAFDLHYNTFNTCIKITPETQRITISLNMHLKQLKRRIKLTIHTCLSPKRADSILQIKRWCTRWIDASLLINKLNITLSKYTQETLCSFKDHFSRLPLTHDHSQTSTSNCTHTRSEKENVVKPVITRGVSAAHQEPLVAI